MGMKYKINEDGSHTIIAKNSNRGVLTLRQILKPGKEVWSKYLHRKPGVKGMLQKIYGTKTNDEIMRDIFVFFWARVTDRVAAGDMFLFPGKAKASMTLKKMPDHKVRWLRGQGLYTEIDIIKSGLVIPEFKIDLGPKSTMRDFTMYPPKKFREKAFRAAENREVTWQFVPKTYTYADVFDRGCDA